MVKNFWLKTAIALLINFKAWAENVYCTYYRNTNEITCGTVTCQTHVPFGDDLEEEGLDTKLPLGWYRIGTLQIRHDTSWFNLYRRRASGSGYWDFYTMIPERNCIGLSRNFGLHAGENLPGSVTLKDKRCFDRLIRQIERKTTNEKFDVYQCRKCIFNTCWLGTRLLPAYREYLTNLRSI
ncbi:unnamed protein product [Onchocerca ochengi]|uniref:Conserved secreted protein n=1 Tax=Onchocerca ochengi TaxID=42157 RepID=A0A182EJV7_ONCOC|nr:unnamed protein product [Onchocerca ochengi]